MITSIVDIIAVIIPGGGPAAWLPGLRPHGHDAA